MDEKITIREAARRLGVSDTAVHKAIKAGRISPPAYTDTGRAFFGDFDAVAAQWNANSTEAKRSHVGSQGGARRSPDEPRRLW